MSTSAESGSIRQYIGTSSLLRLLRVEIAAWTATARGIERRFLSSLRCRAGMGSTKILSASAHTESLSASKTGSVKTGSGEASARTSCQCKEFSG